MSAESEFQEIKLSLHAINAQLNEAQRIAGIGSWTHTLGTDLPEWSDEMFRIFGIDPSSGVPSYTEFRRLIHPADLPAVDEAIHQITAVPTLIFNSSLTC